MSEIHITDNNRYTLKYTSEATLLKIEASEEIVRQRDSSPSTSALPRTRAQIKKDNLIRKRQKRALRAVSIRNSIKTRGIAQNHRKTRKERALIIEHRAMFKQARKECQKLINRIERYVAAGDLNNAHNFQRVFLNSFSAKLMAFQKANSKIRIKYKSSTVELVNMAKELNMFELEPEIVRLKLVVKNEGARNEQKYRHILVFQIKHKARQYMSRMALLPFMEFEIHQEQYSSCGQGRDRAIGDIIRQINSGKAKFFAEYDIENFYPSIGKGRSNNNDIIALQDWVPLPKAVIQSSVLACNVVIDAPSRYMPSCGSVTNIIFSRRGCPMGSAVSPLIADRVMSDILKTAKLEMPVDASLIVYADNIGILGKTRKSVEQSITPAVRSSERCQFGSLKLVQRQKIRRVYDGFNFLGYHLKRVKRKGAFHTEVRVSQKNLDRFRLNIKKKLKEAQLGSHTPLGIKRALIEEMSKFVQAWCSSFSHAENIRRVTYEIAKYEAKKRGVFAPKQIEEVFLLAFGNFSDQ